MDRQRKFSEKHSFDFPLLSDPDRAVAEQLGVAPRVVPFNKRVTFVIDTDRHIIGVIRSETNMEMHADEALKILANR